MRRIACIARKILGTAPDMRGRCVSAILVSVLKSEEKISYWGLIKHFNRHPDDLEWCGLSKLYCKSWYQFHVLKIYPAVLQKIITRMAGMDTVRGTLLVDSSGFQHR